jgi:hypothetical protein
MNRTFCLRLAVALALSVVASVSTEAFGDEPTAAVISEIQVKLFYGNSGRFSANLATKKDLVLWNVVIGEGVGVDGPSENTLLLVTVNGNPKVEPTGLRLHVTAKAGEKTLLDHACPVGTFNTSGNWYAPFLLYDTGCEPVVVAAQILPDAAAPVKFTIPFECGE